MKTTAVILAWLCCTPLLRGDDRVDMAVAKGLRRIERGAASYPKHRDCFSCHHQTMAIFSLTAARARGLDADKEVLAGQLDFTLKALKPHREKYLKGQGIGGANDTAASALAALEAGGHEPDEITDALLHYLISRQRPDGTWATSGNRPPSEGSPFTVGALAVRALRHFGPHLPPDDEKEKAVRAVERTRAWLLKTEPRTMEDKVFRLLGLLDAGAERREIDAERSRLLEEQNADGSWSQTADLEGDAYATGSALFALRRAGVKTSERAYKRGLWFLLRTQKEDGSWYVKTRSVPIQVFFDNGDPGGKSQFISFAATNWAVLALIEALPPRAIIDGQK